MRRYLSKQARFRIYLCTLSLAYILAFSFLLRANTRAHRLEMDALKARFDALQASVSSSVSADVPVSSDVRESSVSTSSDESFDVPRYFVLGSGRLTRWGYLDIAFWDSSVRRYYFRLGNRDDLRKLVNRLELDSYFVAASIDISPLGGGVRGEAPENFFED